MAGIVMSFFKPPAYTDARSYPWIINVPAPALAADVYPIRMPGVVMPGLVGVQVAAFWTDRGRPGGAALDTIKVKATPTEQPSGFGGTVAYPFAALDTYQQARVEWVGVYLKPGEGVDFEITVGTAGRGIVFGVSRILLFNFAG